MNFESKKIAEQFIAKFTPGWFCPLIKDTCDPRCVVYQPPTLQSQPTFESKYEVYVACCCASCLVGSN